MAAESSSLFPKPLIKSPNRKILIFAGATGGHLFPAISFAEEYLLLHPGSQILLVTSRRAKALIEGRWDSAFKQVQYWESFPFKGALSWTTLKSLGGMLIALFRTLRLLHEFKPHASVGFGSYISFPGVFLSACLRIPSVIHEQNCTPGKATQFLSPFAGLRISSFPKTFSKDGGREVTVGLPLRGSMTAAASVQRAQLKSDSAFQILILGGSQGSHCLNELMLEVFSEFSDEEKSRLAVNHITGNQDAERVRAEYKKMKISAQTHVFFDRMDELYSRSQFAVTRAGANTLFELAFFGLPALVVPYPYAGHHQKENADHFASQNACFAKVEAELSADWMRDLIRRLVRDPLKLREMSESMKRLARPEAGRHMVIEVEKYLETCRS